MTRRIAALLVTAALLAGCGGGGGGGSARVKPSALVTGFSFPDGSRVTVVVQVKDKKSRDVAVDLEFSIDGGVIWQAASGVFAKKELSSSPAGVDHAFTWYAHEDLGTGYWPDTLARATPKDPAGKAGVGDPIGELITHGEAQRADLYANLLADFSPDGALDGFVLVDTRGPDDFAAAHIPGAVSIQYADIQAMGKDALPWPLDTKLVFYCYGGG
jgi:hypothetical protein